MQRREREQKMMILRWPPIYAPPAKYSVEDFGKRLNFFPNSNPCSSIFNSKLSTEASFKCCCVKNGKTHEPSEGFSVLSSDIPWDSDSIWSNFALYLFSLHVPLSFGGLSLVAKIMHQHDLDPQTEALSLFLIQLLELIAALLLLRFTAKSQFTLTSFFRDKKLSVERNWLLTSAIGFGILIVFVLLTSILADRLIGPQMVNNPVLKDILTSSNISGLACILAYCVVTPLLEETIYRGFLLTSLASTMKWRRAVIISSVIFSAAHFSGENFLQLFIIGCVLGCSYCWSGNLSSSIVIHSLYNALTLIITFLS